MQEKIHVESWQFEITVARKKLQGKRNEWKEERR